MAKRSPLPTAYPSIPSGVWTKVTTIPGTAQLGRAIVNFDATNTYRYLILVKPSGVTDAAWQTYITATYGGSAATTSGKPLAPAATAGVAGDQYNETYDDLTTGDIWVYHGSGGALTTLAVDEGR